MQTVIGVMTGTSLDGVDVAALETDGERIGRIGPALTRPYDPDLRACLRALLDRADTLAPGAPEVGAAERGVTDAIAQAVAALGVTADLIGMHGQTILHRPRRRLTWQLGDGPRLAELLGVPVVHDFRRADVEAGGEGAPFVPIFHAAMLPSELPRPLGVLNIGGVANLTYVPEDGVLLACDTGPGNALIDDLVQRRTGGLYDADGALARGGRADGAILDRLLADPWFTRRPPKSLDRLDFAHALDAVAGLNLADAAATLTAFTVRAVAAVPLPAPLTRLVVCGGGRRNRAIMDGLAASLGIPVAPAETLGWDGDALEAQCFAYLAARSVRGLPLSLPGTTGVPRPMTGGRLAPRP